MNSCPLSPLYRALQQALHALSDAYLSDWLRLARLYPHTIALPAELQGRTEAAAAFEGLRSTVGEAPARRVVIELAAQEMERRKGRTGPAPAEFTWPDGGKSPSGVW